MAHKKRVRIFRQNESRETCVCCCVLMMLDYFYRLPGGMNHPTRACENQLYRLLGYHLTGDLFDNRPIRFTRGTPVSAAGYYLAGAGLQVVLHHGEEDDMDNLRRGVPYYPEDVFPFILQKYRFWLEKPCERLKREKCGAIGCSTLTNLLDSGALILAMCFVDSPDGDTLHGIVLDGYQLVDGKTVFHVCNPATGNHTLTGEELLRRMDTPVGIHFLSVREP